MQVFLPYTSILQTAMTLDTKRFNKQIIEVKQIIDAVIGNTDGYKNHPITKMYAQDNKGFSFLITYKMVFEAYRTLLKQVPKGDIQKFKALVWDLGDIKESTGYYEQYYEVFKKHKDYVDTLTEDFKETLLQLFILSNGANDFLLTCINDEYINTMRGRLYVKDKEFYKDFEPYKEYGKQNMYFVDGAWKYYAQKV